MEILVTQRLRLRTWRMDDLQALHDLLSDPLTMSHWPQPFDQARVDVWYEHTVQSMQAHGFARWCCERLQDGRVVGDIGLMRSQLQDEWINDIGYIIDRKYWRLGYALEACEAIVIWARAQGLDTLVANMACENKPSVGVARKLGMSMIREFDNPKNQDKKTCWFELKL